MGGLTLLLSKLGHIKNNKNVSVLWIIILSLLILASFESYQYNIKKQTKTLYADLNNYENYIRETFKNHEEKLIDSANRFSLGQEFNEKDFNVFIFDKDKNIIKTSNSSIELFPSTNFTNNLFLVTDLTGTSLWSTSSDSDLSLPSIFFMHPLVQDGGTITGYYLFQSSKIDSFLNPIFDEAEKFGFINYCYICKNGFKTVSSNWVKHFNAPKEVLKKSLSGEKTIFADKNLFDAQLFAGFYIPDLAMGVVLEKKNNSFIIYKFFLIVTVCFLIFGLNNWFKNPDNIQLTFFLASFFVFVFFLYQANSVRISSKDYLDSQFIFHAKSTQLVINQNLERFQSLLDNLNTLKFDLQLDNLIIENEVKNSGALAAVFYDKADQDEAYKVSTQFANKSWQAPEILKDKSILNGSSFVGPVNDPIYGLVFFIFKSFSGGKRASLVVFSASIILDEIKKTQQLFQSALVLKNSEGYVIYSIGSFDEATDRQTLLLPTANWTLEIQKSDNDSIMIDHKILNITLFSLLIFVLVSIFYFAEQKNVIFGFSTINLANILSIILLISYIFYGSLSIKNYAFSQIINEISSFDELNNQLSVIDSNFYLNNGRALKKETIILDIKKLDNTGVTNINLKGLIQLNSQIIDQIDIWNASPSIIPISKKAEATAFDINILDNTNMIFFPLNPILIRLPINLNTSEEVIGVIDENNIKQMQRLTLSGLKVIKAGARYVVSSNNQLPNLEYLIVFERGLFNAILSFIIPLVISIAILYQGFLVLSKDEISIPFVAIWGSVLFTIVIVQSNYRKFVGDIPFTFLENFFIASFLFIILVQSLILGPIVAKKQKNLVFLKKFYFTGWLFIVSLFVYNTLIS